jgi:hypothetical protein
VPALCSHPTTSRRRRYRAPILAVNVGEQAESSLGIGFRRRVIEENRHRVDELDPPRPQRRERLLEPSYIPTVLGQQCESAFCRPFHPHASEAERLVRAAEQPTLGRVEEVNGVMIRKHELDSPERVFRARRLNEPGQSALAVLPNESGPPQLTAGSFSRDRAAP